VSDRARLQGVAFIAALVLLGAWLLLHVWLAFHTDSSDVEWMRLVSLVGSIEAVAFAAAGALFGTTVQRQRVEEARRRADEAEEREEEAKTASAANAELAANGRALAAAVKVFDREPDGKLASSRVSAAEGVNKQLVSLARTLFPD